MTRTDTLYLGFDGGNLDLGELGHGPQEGRPPLRLPRRRRCHDRRARGRRPGTETGRISSELLGKFSLTTSDTVIFLSNTTFVELLEFRFPRAF